MSENTVPAINTRVRKKNSIGCLGTVKEVRQETVGSAGDTREKAIIVRVLWDNGTLSFFDPDALENIE